MLEEDTVVPGSDRPPRAADQRRDLYLQETLTRWDGWSLAVPRVGEPFQGAGPTNAERDSSGFNVTTDWHVPGSCRRRGRDRDRQHHRCRGCASVAATRLRARAADLAGNALPVDSARQTGDGRQPAACGTCASSRSRLRGCCSSTSRCPGGSEEVVVVRSESATVDGAGDLDNPMTVRLLVPAPTSVFMAEQHGVLELAATSGRPMNQAAAA